MAGIENFRGSKKSKEKNKHPQNEINTHPLQTTKERLVAMGESLHRTSGGECKFYDTREEACCSKGSFGKLDEAQMKV
jgi:hypothetical protein